MSFLDTTSVSELMTREVTIVSPDDSLLEAASLMYKDGITCVLVDNGDPALGFGILTQKDLIRSLADSGPGFAGAKVGDEMSGPCLTLTPFYTIATALQLMRSLGLRRAPVVDGADLVGILSFTDVFHAAMGQLDCKAA